MALAILMALAISLALVTGFALCAVGVAAAFISASANMSFNNPLPRAGCALLGVGGALIALGIWGLRA